MRPTPAHLPALPVPERRGAGWRHYSGLLHLCYQVEAQGQTLAFFQDPGTYDQAVAQAEDRASQILEAPVSLNQDLTLTTALAPKDQIESLSGVTSSILESIPQLDHVYTLTVDGTTVGVNRGCRRHHPGPEPGEGALHHRRDPVFVH